MVGLVARVDRTAGAGFPKTGLTIALLGSNTDELGGSEYLALMHRRVAGRPPALDLARERDIGTACRKMVESGLLASAHDCAEGGLAVALAECCVMNEH